MGMEGGEFCKRTMASEQISTREENPERAKLGPGVRPCLIRPGGARWQPDSLVVKRHLLLLGVNVHLTPAAR